MGPEVARAWYVLAVDVLSGAFGPLILGVLLTVAVLWHTWQVNQRHEKTVRLFLEIQRLRAEAVLKAQKQRSSSTRSSNGTDPPS